jgi:IS30 family transposase
MKGKHLTDGERQEIEHGLRHGLSIKKVAAGIGKHRSTVAREVKARRTASDKGAFGRVTNRCVRRARCDKRQLCGDKPDCVKRCCACRLCNGRCPDFREEVCLKLAFPPYVCNGCRDEPRCVLRKQYYLHRPAHGNYRGILAECRSGANITQDELLALDEVVSPAVKRGQSVHHVLVNNPDLFDVHEKTVYRYIAGGLLRAKNGDMPRVCTLRPRKRKPVEHKVDRKCRVGRTYADFQQLLAAAPETRVVEMDTVVGRVGGKAVMTLFLRDCGLMLGFLRHRNDARSVAEAFERLWALAGAELFRRALPVILTDNGSEFSNPGAIEADPGGNPRTRVFYCDPLNTNQKARIERDHEHFRKVLPKGSSFDALGQADIDKVFSHVGSYSRPSLNDKAPFDLFSFLYGAETLAKLGLRRIPSNEIVLRPELLC